MARVDYLDEILHALADQHRRYALYHLQEADERDVESLVRQVAAWSAGKSVGDVTDDELQPLLVEFRHNHLEALREAGCIEYDERSGVIRYRDPPRILEAVLNVLAPIEHPERY